MGVVETQRSAQAVERMADELHELLARFQYEEQHVGVGS
jgi:hypothetical protein